MSLRARLLLALAAILAVALLVAGVLLVQLTRASLVERMDRELVSLTDGTARIQRLGDLTGGDATAGRRLAVLRFDRQGRLTQAIPSGFATDPDPLPALPANAADIPADAYGRIQQLPSVDGSMEYRVLLAKLKAGATLAIAAPLSTIDEAQRTLVRTMVVVGGAAMIVMLVLAWFVIRRGLLPLERIAGAAQAISAGDLTQRAGIPHDGTEVGRLGTAFDTMLDQIEDAFVEQQDGTRGQGAQRGPAAEVRGRRLARAPDAADRRAGLRRSLPGGRSLRSRGAGKRDGPDRDRESTDGEPRGGPAAAGTA